MTIGSVGGQVELWDEEVQDESIHRNTKLLAVALDPLKQVDGPAASNVVGNLEHFHRHTQQRAEEGKVHGSIPNEINMWCWGTNVQHTARLFVGRLHHSCGPNHDDKQSRQLRKRKSLLTTLNLLDSLRETQPRTSRSMVAMNIIIQDQRDKLRHLILLNTVLEVFLKRGNIHEVGKAGSELRVFDSLGLQLEPEVRVDCQKQAIKPPVRMSVMAMVMWQRQRLTRVPHQSPIRQVGFILDEGKRDIRWREPHHRVC